jgi:hypothetical protein
MRASTAFALFSSLLGLTGCVMSPEAVASLQSDVAIRNQERHEQALRDAERSAGGNVFTPPFVSIPDPDSPGGSDGVGEASADTPVKLPDGFAGRVDGEALYRMPNGKLGFAGPTCLSGDSCGCDVSQEHVFFKRPDGKVIIVRLVPTVVDRTVKLEFCGYGCGMPAPPPPIVVADLGIEWADQVEIRSIRWTSERVVETCDHPTPVP